MPVEQLSVGEGARDGDVVTGEAFVLATVGVVGAAAPHTA
jgi:hypothetical protein